MSSTTYQSKTSGNPAYQSKKTNQNNSINSIPIQAKLENESENFINSSKNKGLGSNSIINNFQKSFNSGNTTPIAPIQTKLTIGVPGDQYEQEADQVAAQVVQKMNASTASGDDHNSIQRKINISSLQRVEEKEEKLQGKLNFQVPNIQADFESTLNSAKSGGSPLDSAFRAKIEPEMNADFSGVRVHNDSAANNLSQSIQAKAFTTGNHIFMKEGEYNPSSKGGQELLAHELTHVVQQNGSAVQRKPQVQREPEETMLFNRVAGNKPETESRTQTAGVGSVTTTETKTEGLAGAEVAVKKITEASDESRKTAIEALARAGVFGEAAAKKEIERGSLKAGAEGKASGMAGAQAEAKFSAEVINVMEGIKLLAELSAKAGVGGDLEGRLYAAAGPLAGELSAKLSAFAGVLAEAKGNIQIGVLTGLIVEGSVKVMAGAKAEGEVKALVKLDELGVDATLSGEALAGAEAGAEGKLQISLLGVSASGKAEAFAGAKVKGGAATSLTYKGKMLIKISGEAEASAGVGGSIEGEFTFSNGKLKVGGKMAAALGIGGGVGATLEIDFAEIGHAIFDLVKRALTTKAAIDRSSIADQDRELMPTDKAAEMNQALYEAIVNHFKAYAKKKEKYVSDTSFWTGKRKAEHLVKREEIQKIIDKQILNKTPLSQWVKFKESDLTLTQAAMDAFGDMMKPGGLVIQAGIIRAFDPKKADQYIAEKGIRVKGRFDL